MLARSWEGAGGDLVGEGVGGEEGDVLGPAPRSDWEGLLTTTA